MDIVTADLGVYPLSTLVTDIETRLSLSMVRRFVTLRAQKRSRQRGEELLPRERESEWSLSDTQQGILESQWMVARVGSIITFGVRKVTPQ